MTLLLTFIQKAIGQGVAILFGASGEIVTEKSGNLNLGIPGIMYMGGIAGLMGAFFYEKSTETPNGAIGVLVSLLCSLDRICPGRAALQFSDESHSERTRMWWDLHLRHLVLDSVTSSVVPFPSWLEVSDRFPFRQRRLHTAPLFRDSQRSR